MTTASRQSLFAALIATASPSAHAQHVPAAIAIAAVSPILFLLLAAVLGWMERSLLSGLVHTGLIVLWLASFAVLSNAVTIDWLVWTPVVLYGIQCCWIVTRLVTILVRRRATTSPRSTRSD